MQLEAQKNTYIHTIWHKILGSVKACLDPRNEMQLLIVNWHIGKCQDQICVVEINDTVLKEEETTEAGRS